MRFFLFVLSGTLFFSTSFECDAVKKDRKKASAQHGIASVGSVSPLSIKLIDFPDAHMHKPLLILSLGPKKSAMAPVLYPYKDVKLPSFDCQNMPFPEELSFVYFENPENLLELEMPNQNDLRPFQDRFEEAQKPQTIRCQKTEGTDLINERIGVQFGFEENILKCTWFDSFQPL